MLMLRQLLAFFALLSGLATIGVPVHAAVGGAAGAVFEQSDTREEEPRTKRAPCLAKEPRQRLRDNRPDPCVRPASVTIYVPTVMFGPDRAYE